MDSDASNGSFQYISQRVAYSYRRSFSEFTCVVPEGLDPGQQGEMEASQRDMHEFFRGFYEKLFQSPELFGLPLAEDDSIEENEPNEKDKKQEVQRKLLKPREVVDRGLDFLMLAGRDGKLEGQKLLLDQGENAALVKQLKVGRKFLTGLKSAGLLISETDGKAILSSARFPAMLPALKTLAARCAQNPDPKLGKFNFARCDFKALAADYSPQVMDLYRVFSASDYAILSRLHAFFTEMGYQPLVRIYGIFSWEVKYQGKRQIKATPLFQVEYSERYKNPFRLHVKCASTNRIAALIPRQPRSLQEDFFKRANRCNGDKCGWCKNRPNLGPTVLEHDGSPVTLCWYTNPDVRVIDEDTVDLMKQYAWMHEELV